MRLTNRSDTSVGHNDPRIQNGMVREQRIKATLGITGLFRVRDLIDHEVCHLDVDSTYPPRAKDWKGLAVRQLKGYVSWVKNVVKQFGSYLLYIVKVKEEHIFSTQGSKCFNLWFNCCKSGIILRSCELRNSGIAWQSS